MVPLPLDKFIYKEITIQGVLSHDTTSVEPAIKMVQTAKYPWEDMVTHVYSLKEAERAIKVVAGQIEEGHPIKVALDPWL
jgi:threonine dehydrogenase-like Zn-dependent dehydrogenase